MLSLWIDTARILAAARRGGPAIDEELTTLLFSWHVVGIPKKQPGEKRPIGVASVLLRAWLSACALALPTPSADQWATKKKTSVVHAIADWLHHCCDAQAGCETDLSKAYDNIDHEIGAAALAHEAIPEVCIASATAVWKGPRLCQVEGELASEPVWPTCGLPQGDSMAPGAMVGTLVPWSPSMRKWKFMDDRSMTAPSDEALEENIQYTCVFDRDIGYQENIGKRQRWKRGDFKRRTH